MGKKRLSVPGEWKPSRNPLVEQMHEMPPPTYRKGRMDKARIATFDPTRGVFVSLARPNSPEIKIVDRGRGVRLLPHLQGLDHLKAIMAFERNSREPLTMPPIHKKPPPAGTRLGADVPKCLRRDEPTRDEVACMWTKYKQALDRAMTREGELEGISWRHRGTKEPAPAEPRSCCQHRRHFDAPPGTEMNVHHWSGADPSQGKENSPRAPCPPPRSRGRRACNGMATKSLGQKLLTGEGFELKRPRPPKLPPSWRNGPRLDDLLDDTRARHLTAPIAFNQRKHISGPPSHMDTTISPMEAAARRALNARAMHELTARLRW